MLPLLLTLMPVALAAAILPFWIIIVVMLLQNENGAKKALVKKDDEKPTPALMQSLTQATTTKAFLNGFLLMGVSVKHWVFTLSAISIISYSTLDYLQNYIAYVLYILFTQVLLYLLILTAGLYPERFTTLIEKLSTKIAPYSKVLLAGISVLFGIWLILKGLNVIIV